MWKYRYPYKEWRHSAKKYRDETFSPCRPNPCVWVKKSFLWQWKIKTFCLVSCWLQTILFATWNSITRMCDIIETKRWLNQLEIRAIKMQLLWALFYQHKGPTETLGLLVSMKINLCRSLIPHQPQFPPMPWWPTVVHHRWLLNYKKRFHPCRVWLYLLYLDRDKTRLPAALSCDFKNIKWPRALCSIRRNEWASGL